MRLKFVLHSRLAERFGLGSRKWKPPSLAHQGFPFGLICSLIFQHTSAVQHEPSQVILCHELCNREQDFWKMLLSRLQGVSASHQCQLEAIGWFCS